MQGGTGKTTALSVLTLGGLYSSGGGKVYGSAPTHTAVTNFALRVYGAGRDVAKFYNDSIATSVSTAPPSPRRCPLVLRGYADKIEVSCFKNILKQGVADDSAFATKQGETPRWRLALSPTNWLLAVLGSKALEESEDAGAVKKLAPEHATYLHEMQAEIDALNTTGAGVYRMAQLVRGELTWKEYCDGRMADERTIRDLMVRIIRNADVVLTTPAGAHSEWYQEIWDDAEVIAVDEAGCLNQAELCSIWGNTLRPIICAGDVKQLTPTMMELDTVDEAKNYPNRFALAGRVSALAWLLAAGIPSFRLLRQLRMCRGMFDLANKLFYTDYGTLAYGPWSDPSCHPIGLAFETYLSQQQFTKPWTPSPAGSLLPVFLHVPNSEVISVGTSKLNRTQVKAGLKLLADFAKQSGVHPSNFVVISAHKPNVEYANRLLKAGAHPELGSMERVQTADSFQGREGAISVVILGTKEKISAGFVSNENRLNVMLTRQKSGLLIIGDKLVTGILEGTEKELTKADKEAAKGQVPSHTTTGEKVFSRVRALRSMLRELQTMGRIVELDSSKDEEEAGEEVLVAEEMGAAEIEERDLVEEEKEEEEEEEMEEEKEEEEKEEEEEEEEKEKEEEEAAKLPLQDMTGHEKPAASSAPFSMDDLGGLTDF
jgi:hypothetical protein